MWSTFDTILVAAVVVLLGLLISQRSRARRGGPDTSSDMAGDHGHGHGHGDGHGFDGHGHGGKGGMVEANRARGGIAMPARSFARCARPQYQSHGGGGFRTAESAKPATSVSDATMARSCVPPPPHAKPSRPGWCSAGASPLTRRWEMTELARLDNTGR